MRSLISRCALGVTLCGLLAWFPAAARAQNPVGTAPATASGEENALIAFIVTATAPPGETILSFSAAPLPTGATFSVNASQTSGTFSWTPSFNQLGTHSVTFTAISSQGLSGSATTMITVGQFFGAPIVTAPATVTGQVGNLLTFTVSAVDPNGGAITSLIAAPLPTGASFISNAAHTSGTFSWTPSSGQSGNNSVTFTAVDGSGLSGSATTSITVSPPADRPPVVVAPANVQGLENTLITFLVTASDPDGDPIASFTASPLPSGATFSTNASHTAGTFAWTPNFAQAGVYAVTFTASNALSGSATTSICVCGPDRAPVVTAPGFISKDGCQTPLIFTVTAADPDGDAIVSFTASGLPSGATFTSNAANTAGTFVWTPSFAQEGNTYAVTFVASNTLTGSATTSISVGNNCFRPPVVIAPSTVTGSEETPIIFTVSAFDPDGDPLASLTAAPLPSGATFTAAASSTSGTFSWTPALGQAGSYGVTFTASNSLSGMATTSITVAPSALAARAFTTNANRTIRLNSGKALWSVSVEPVEGSFSVLEIDLTSVALISQGTGVVSQIAAFVGKSVVVGDADKNSVQDITFDFRKEDLRLLFSGVSGRQTLPVTVAGGLVTGGSFTASLSVDVIGSGGALAASIRPNPLNPSGTLSFYSSRAGVARVRLFDQAGRLVRVVSEGEQSSGYHEVRLDGRDGQGRPLASGIYFYRVDTTEGFATGRFTVLK